MGESLMSVKTNKPRILANKADITKFFLACVFIVLVFVPLIRMFSNMDAASIQKVFHARNFSTAVTNSLVSAALSTAITIALAYTLALCVERTNIRLKGLFRILFVLPMLIPSISNGMGLIILFGNNGLLTKMLGLQSGIYGLTGIVMGSVLYAFPVAFLMISDIMKYEDSSPYEAAQVLGLSKFRRFTAITLPYMRKPMISVIFAVFTLIVTDYGVPLMVGGKYVTIPRVMYEEVIGQLDFGKGAVYGSLLLIPAVVAFILDLMNQDKAASGFVARPFTPDNGRMRKLLSYLLCFAVCVFVLLPLVSFAVLGFAKDYPNDLSFTMANLNKAIRLKADDYLVHSLIMAFFVSVFGVVIAFVTAYMTARMQSKISRFLHLASITSAAIPGIVLGLSYVLVFKGSVIYGTLAILVMVNVVHFISSPYLMMYNSLCKLNPNLEGVGQTLGIHRLRMIKDVFLPQCKSTLVEMFSYFFVNAMMTISAVSFLATTANKPVSLMINQFESQMQLECAAVVSLAILGVNLLIKAVARLAKSKTKSI